MKTDRSADLLLISLKQLLPDKTGQADPPEIADTKDRHRYHYRRGEMTMKICKCESCRYIFRYPVIPSGCPDCGQRRVRAANIQEIRSYLSDQKILREEIRKGLYAAAG